MKQRFQWVNAALLASLMLTGCKSSESTISTLDEPWNRPAIPRRVEFDEQEVLTRTWRVGDVQFTLLEGKEFAMPGSSSKLLLCKYGNAKTGRVYCLDYYKKTIAVFGEPFLELIHHDSREMHVSSLKVVTENNKLYFDITRDSANTTPAEFTRNTYGYWFDSKFHLTEASHDIWLPPPKGSKP